MLHQIFEDICSHVHTCHLPDFVSHVCMHNDLQLPMSNVIIACLDTAAVSVLLLPATFHATSGKREAMK